MFTGNTFYYTYAALRKKLKWLEVVKLWIFSYAGNILGACTFALLIFLTGLFTDSSVNGFLLNVVEHKMTTPTVQLFLERFCATGSYALPFSSPCP